MAAQLMAKNGLRLRGESRCSASATSSLPEPVGPSIRTGVLRGATRRTRRLTSSITGALPISSGRGSMVGAVRGDATMVAATSIGPWCRTASATRKAGSALTGGFLVSPLTWSGFASSRSQAVFQAAVSVSWFMRSAYRSSWRYGLRGQPSGCGPSLAMISTRGKAARNSRRNSASSRSGSQVSTIAASGAAASASAQACAPDPASRTFQRSPPSLWPRRLRKLASELMRMAVRGCVGSAEGRDGIGRGNDGSTVDLLKELVGARQRAFSASQPQRVAMSLER